MSLTCIKLCFIIDFDEDQAVLVVQRSCHTVFLHNIKQADREMQHAFCPMGPESWCSYQKDKDVSSTQRRDYIKDKKQLDSMSENILFTVYHFKAQRHLISFS